MKQVKSSRKVVVVGYATVDYAVQANEAFTGPGTYSVEALSEKTWPRVGGASFYASSRIALAGHEAYPLVTIGNDANGALYSNECRRHGIFTDGIDARTGGRTPWCTLIYHSSGGSTCLVDRGAPGASSPTEAQLQLLLEADYVCVAAGSAGFTETLLKRLPDEIPLAWIAKHDAGSFPSSLATRLAQRAELIFCNAVERSWVEEARQQGARENQCVVETRGAEGVVLERAGKTIPFSASPVEVRDPTGAGDTLAGEVIAGVVGDDRDLERGIYKGMEAARSMLQARAALYRCGIDAV